MESAVRFFGEYNTVVLYETSDDTTMSAGAVIGVALLAVAALVVMLASMWHVFKKAGRPGWAALVPIYNTLQLIWTAGKPWWWLLLLCIPIVNIIAAIVLYYGVARAFGKGVGYTLLLVFIPIIGFPLLAWGGATYRLKKPKKGM